MRVLPLLGIPALLTVAAAAHADLRYVAGGGVDVGSCTTASAPCETIQYAIDRSASGDTIRLHEGGVYRQTVEISSAVGTLTIEGGWADGFGWQHADPVATIIDGDDSDSVFLLDPSSGSTDLRLAYLTVRGGSNHYGGGVAVHSFGTATTNVTLDHVVLEDNHAGTGGGAAARAIGGSAQVELRIEHCTIEGNIAGEGGGVAAIADLGGTTNVVLESSMVIRNEAQEWPDSNGYGSAVYANSTRLGSASVDAVNSVVVQNSAEEGGIYGSSGYCQGCGDSATTHLELINSTVTGNGTTGVVARSWDHGQTIVVLVNTIAWGNSFFDIAATGDWLDSEVTAWHSDIQRTDIGHDATYSEIGGVLDVDPLFVEPASDDYHLSAESDLIDAGICGIFPGYYLRLAPLFDVDGELRPPAVLLWGCDIGADEYLPFDRWVRPGGNDLGNTCTDSANPCATVQHALDQAFVAGGRYQNRVHLQTGTYAEALTIAGALAPVTLQGGWSDSFSSRDTSGLATVIDANGSGSALSFAATSGGAKLTLESLTLTDGAAVDGGGLEFTCTLGFGRLDLRWVVLTDNHATDSGGGMAVRAIACDLEIRIADTLITDNTAVNGGGGAWIRSDTGSATHAVVHLATVAGNEAGYGGGLGFVQTGNGKGWLFLYSVVLALNSGATAPEDDLWLEEVGTNFVWAEAADSDIQTVTQWGGATYMPEPTVIDVNPGFADPVAGDYHLTPYSPVLDLGSCHPRSPFDCDGEPRPFGAGCDMGADEYAGGWRPPLDLWITHERLDGIQLREACRSVLVGPGVTVDPGSVVELRASASVSFNDGFEVASGGSLMARNYFNPACLVPFP